MNKTQFINNLARIDNNIKYQFWYKGYPSKSWFTYEDIIKEKPYLFKVNNEILRTGINLQELQELRLDIETLKDNKKDFNATLETTKKIIKILDEYNLKYSVYYSGGIGFHIHLLYDNKPFSQYDNKKIREAITKNLGIFNLIDKNLLSNKVMLTCEGYTKRNNINKNFTARYTKTYIPKEIIEKDLIKNYVENIKTNKNINNVINSNYFNEINEFNLNFIKIILNKLEDTPNNSLDSQNKDFISSNDIEYPQNLNNQNVEKELNKLQQETIIKHLICFKELYETKNITSTNDYYTIIVNYLINATNNYNLTLKYFELYFYELKGINNLTCSIQEKVKTIYKNYNFRYNIIFFSNEYITKEEYYSKYYSLFPDPKRKQ